MEGAAAAAANMAVLDDDDLLGEILLRLAFPTSLVRAALVCKRWLCLASAPAFLRRFRELHPPSLLGFYVTTHKNPPRFVPMPQPPELAAVVRRGSFNLDTMCCDMLDVDYCWNGLLLITSEWYRDGRRDTYTRSVCCPLYPARSITSFPPTPKIHDRYTYCSYEILPSERGDGLSYFYLAVRSKKQRSFLDVYVLQEGIWAIHTSVVTKIPITGLLLPSSFIVADRIYNLARVSCTVKLFSLDLSSSRLSLVKLPEEVESLRTDLSRENDSEVHLIHVKDSQLRTWLYTVDNNSWLPVSAICFHETCANHMIPTTIFEDSDLLVYAVGANSGLLFLHKDEVLYLFDIKRKTAKKVFEVTREDRHLYQVRPFMMVWPPKFPMMKEGCDPIE